MKGIAKPKHKKSPPPAVFLSTAMVIFFLSVSAADSIDFVPCYVDATCPPSSDSLTLNDLPQLGETSDTTSFSAPAPEPGVLPTHISIPSIDLDLDVQNPNTRDVDALDALLQYGPARHPDSAELGQSGNMVIFGHSSHLPLVHNKMFQAFNKVPDLSSGATIILTGADGKEYVYSVDSVEKATAGQDTQNFLADPSKKLYIITCDTLTGKSARYILTAEFIGTN